MGPVDGVQTNPKASPAMGAAEGRTLKRSGWHRRSRCSDGADRVLAPAAVPLPGVTELTQFLVGSG